MKAHTDRAEALAKLAQLTKGIKYAMLTTVTADGALRSRPMATVEHELDGVLWFFTSAASPKVEEIESDQQINLSYAAPDDHRFVSISGRAALVRDKEKARELFTPALKAWFPNGVDDPDLALLRVTIESAEYWDAPAATMVKLYGMAKALLTGERYQGGENEKLSFEEDAR